MRLRTLALLTATAVLALAAGAQAADPVQLRTVAYTTYSSSGAPRLWAKTASTAPVSIAKGGSGPSVSPRGDLIAYGIYPAKGRPQLVVTRSDGTGTRALAEGLSYTGERSAVWSPDETLLATIVGPEIGKQQLVLVNVADGATRTVATGYFNDVSFSPDGTQLAYGLSAKAAQQGANDIYVTTVAEGGAAVNVTKDGKSVAPLWGPKAIVFSHLTKPKRRDDYPKANLQLVQGDGTGRKTLTRVAVPYLIAGLYATAWSADGKHLLAEYGGQDYSEAWTVDLTTGKARDLTGQDDGVTGFGISTDGRTVLAGTGGFDPAAKSNLVTIPFKGGAKKTLVKNASWATWAGF